MRKYIENHKTNLIFTCMYLLLILSFLTLYFITYSEYVTSTIWDGTVAESFTRGTGTEDDPYAIMSGSELAYFFTIINGEDSAQYYNKYYSLKTNINLNNIDFSFARDGKFFSGTFDGNGYTISNLNISSGYNDELNSTTNYALFDNLVGATIKNLNINDSSILSNVESSVQMSVLASEASGSNIKGLSINNATLNASSSTSVSSALINTDNGNNVIENIHISISSNATIEALLINDYENSLVDNIIYLDSESEIINDYEEEIENVFTYTISDGEISISDTLDDLLDSFSDACEYDWAYNNGYFRLKNTGVELKPLPPFRAPLLAASPTLSAHDSGVFGNTVYINDLNADYDYYKGLNFTGVWSTNPIPNGDSTNYFDDDKLVEVQITYNGTDLNHTNLTGYVSPIGTEANVSKYVYYKYYPYERNKNGSLLTDSNGNYYIHIELIDNPYSKRPASGNIEYGFNGWVCNNTGSTSGLCDSAKLKYDDDYYTRYLDVPVTLGSPLIINLNANWIPADVKTSTNASPDDFNDKGMQVAGTPYTVQEMIPVDEYTWNANYYTFTYNNRINNNSNLQRYRWYVIGSSQPSATNQTYTLVYVSSNNTKCPAGRNNYCYQYTATQNDIRQGDLYTPGDEYFIVKASDYSTYNNMNGYYGNRANTTYMNHITERLGDVTYYNSLFTNGNTTAGYYYKVTNPTTNQINTGEYYNEDGTLCTSASSCRTAYKLIQYNDSTLNSAGTSIYTIRVDTDDNVIDKENYYYLVTRDTNIFKLSSAVNASNYTSTKPYTLTGYTNGAINGTLNISNGARNPTYYKLTANNDLVIENIKFSGMSNNGGSDLGVGDASFANAVIYANSQNLKIGRNITNSSNTNYIVANSIVGGSSNAISGGFKVIVEAGHFNGYTSGTGASNGGTINEITVFGNDYDRVQNENTKLWFNLGLEGYSHGNHSPGNDSLFVSMNYIKSGTFGYNGNGTASSDNNAGLYITARAGHYVSGLTGAKIEGGRINNIVGGYGFNGSDSNNSTFIAMTGGNARIIYGGAGTSATYGNRIISVTGGSVEYSVLGGSNSYTGSSDDGKLTSNTLVYIGGNATIGTSAHVNAGDTLYNVESGSVFGAGGGRSGSSYTGLGTVNNSHVIINGGTIYGSVYGGGNYGSTGTQYTGTSKTVVDVYDGTINNSVFGGSKSSGFGKEGTQTSNTITINTYGGTIGNIYGGSDSAGICYGSTILNIQKCNIAGSVYGGGKGGFVSSSNTGTFVSNNVDIIIGTAEEGPVISGNVYGGSALGTVNASTYNAAYSSSKHVNVTVNKGTITGAVFGGAQGSSSVTPYVKGNITVRINDGTIGEVYGGFDAAGSPVGTDNVYLNGGTITSAFGGGAKTAITTSNIYLRGATVTDLYGGSNQSGAVGTTNVHIENGTAANVYGGNNVGGSCTTSNITMTGGTVTSTVYGGGNEVSTTTTNVDINGGTVTAAVYGGGNKANATTTHVDIDGGDVGDVYGGANDSGTSHVQNSYVTLTSGIAANVYGGNNVTGSTTTTHLDLVGGTCTNVFGGGNATSTTTSNVNLKGSTVTGDIFGGSNSAGVVSNTNVTTTSGTCNNLYGGNNVGGSATITHVNYQGATCNNVYGGSYGSAATTGTSNATITGGTINHAIYGGGYSSSTTTSNVTLTNANNTISYVFGGGNAASVGDTYVHLNGGNIGIAFGGSNASGSIDSTNIYLSGTNILSSVTLDNPSTEPAGNIFGGNNAGGTVDTTNVYVTSGTARDIYGGNNAGGTTGDNNITMTGGTINNVYGGGNNAVSTTTNTSITNANVINNVFGGGNAANVTGNTEVEISSTTIGGHLYGGGNEGDVGGSTSITSADNTTVSGNVYGGGNQGAVEGSSSVDLSTTTVSGYIYGGGNQNNVGTNTSVILSSDSICSHDVYGGGNEGAVYGSTGVEINESSVNGNIFGGGNEGAVTGSVNVDLNESTIGETVYGGGNAATVGENVTTNVTSTSIGGHLYGGGNGNTAVVFGSTLVNIDGTTDIEGNVFGGGNAAQTGNESTDNSTGEVNIVGGTIGRNVYGGANTSVLYGTSTVKIGYNAVNNSELIKSDIDIGGTVFGGGEANASGSEMYDFSFISITGGTNIIIDGAGHDNFDIHGSIFGSGNASSSEGASIINIKNYGTFDEPKTNISIQRASLVTIDNSALILKGATDRTNDYSNVLFSVSIVDHLKIKNNSTIFFVNSTNLVQEFTSCVDNGGTEEKATVNIDTETNTTTKNVDNRIYAYQGRNINIAKDQSVTTYGKVNGMTFFGLFHYTTSGTAVTAMYDASYDNNDSVNGSDAYYFTKGSYVLGEHSTNHDITVDGFYSNYVDEDEPTIIYQNYIEPTPPNALYYMWFIGEQVKEYSITITASKFSTLGTYELALLNHSNPNTTFNIVGFNSDDLDPSVNLVDPSSIRRIATSTEIADTTYALTIKTSNNGWVSSGSTNFYTNDSVPVTGTTSYQHENSTITPSLIFYLYHSKNIATTGAMGTGVISLIAITPIDDLNSEVERLNINVTLDRALYASNDYEGSLTTGKQYELFASSGVNITSKSSFSAYYSLFSVIDPEHPIYGTGYHHSLVSTYNFPANTKITMIDLAAGENPEYYYYIVTAADEAAGEIAISNQGEVAYNISKFIKMGSEDIQTAYNETTHQALYTHSDEEYIEEEFIFMVDLLESGITEDATGVLTFEIQDASNQTKINVLSAVVTNLTYNIYAGNEAYIDVTGTISKNNIYGGESATVTANSDFEQSVINTVSVIDTNFYDKKMGLKLSIFDSEGNQLNGLSAAGISYTFNNITYYPNVDGTVRINVSGNIANISSKIKLNINEHALASGEYTIKIESFVSPDGIYYGLESSDYTTVTFNYVDLLYGLKANTNEANTIIDKTTGKSLLDTNSVMYSLDYNSGLENPAITMVLQRRLYDSEGSLYYEIVDLQDYVVDSLTTTVFENEYLVTSEPTSSITQYLHYKENLPSGTYKLVFKLYDSQTAVEDVFKYVIIK